MSRTHPVSSSRPRRRIAMTIIAGGLVAGGLVAVPSPASASGLSTTLSSWSSSEFGVSGSPGTKVTLAAGVDRSGVVGRNLATTRTVSVKIESSTCTTGPAGDLLVTRSLATETPVGSGVSVDPLRGSASVKATVTATGTETSTPAGTGGDCNELNPGGAMSAPISEQVTVDATWRNKPGSSPLVYGDIYQQGVFYYRDAVASGKITSATTGANKSLTSSANGWLWSGAWIYATRT